MKTAPAHTADLKLAFGFDFADLYERDGLVRLDRAFLDRLQAADPALANRLLAARAEPSTLTAKDEGNLLIELGPHLEAFIAELFGIEKEVRELAARTHALEPLYACKRLFVQRQAVKAFKSDEVATFDGAALASALEARMGEALTEISFARHVMAWEKTPDQHKGALDLALRYAAWATLTDAGKAKHGQGVLFKVPRKIDPMNLVPVETIEIDGVRMMRLPEHEWRQRDGFALTDPGAGLVHALDQMNYCIWCHNQGKDSC